MLEKYRITNNLTYRQLASQLGLSVGKVHRICTQELCIKLADANKIQILTNNAVTIQDLTTEGC